MKNMHINMKIGLIDVDSHNFPNLALMKISAYHKGLNHDVEWVDYFKRYDVVYKSKVFDSSIDISYSINSREFYIGGTGYKDDSPLPNYIEHISPDYSLYPKFKDAYGFLTRGCPRKCKFCIVSKKEGVKSEKVADLKEFWNGQNVIKLLDPNILACREHEELLNQLIASKAKIDFTQGLDARLVNKDNVKLLKQIRFKYIHFAFDNIKDEKQILKGLNIFKQATDIDGRNAIVYILVNFNTTDEEDMYRIKKTQEAGFMPYIMVYNKPTSSKLHKKLQRWSNDRRIYFSSQKCFSNYNKTGEKDLISSFLTT